MYQACNAAVALSEEDGEDVAIYFTLAIENDNADEDLQQVKFLGDERQKSFKIKPSMNYFLFLKFRHCII